MRPLDLTLNGLPADLPATVKGLLKLQQARVTLADVAARVGEYSFPLTLPPTRGNARIFGAAKLHPQGLNKFGPHTDYAYRLAVGGEVFTGTFRLTSLRNGYTGSLIGAGISWALLLAGRKLTELALAPVPGYNGSQLAGILTKDCDATDAQFPLIAWGNFFAPPLQQLDADGNMQEVPAPAAAVLDYPLAVDDYPPGVYYVNVLRAIFRSIGWHLVGRELDSPFWRQVVFTCAGGDVRAAWPWGSLLKASATNGGTRPNAYSYFASDPLNTGSQYSNTAAGFSTDSEVCFLPVPTPHIVSAPTRALDAAGAAYTAPSNGVYTFDWACTVAVLRQTVEVNTPLLLYDQPIASGFRSVGLGLVVSRGGQSFDGGDGGLCLPLSGGSYAPGQDRVLSPQVVQTGTPAGLSDIRPAGSFSGTPTVYLEAGDVVRLCIFAQRRAVDTNSGNAVFTRIEFYCEFQPTRFAVTHYEDDEGLSRTDLEPARFLPPLTCAEVVKDFLLRTDSFIVADPDRQVATILTRAELSEAAGPALDLSARVDPQSVEYLPVAGAGVGSLVFSPAGVAEAGNTDSNPLVGARADVVTAPLGPGEGSQAIGSLFAVVGFRTLYGATGAYGLVPTCASKETLAQKRSEVDWPIDSEAPRLVRYTGPDAVRVIPFGTGTLPLAGAAWDGPLAWDGAAGAVGTYYVSALRRMVQGHNAKASLPLSPAEFRALSPGRRVTLYGAGYVATGLTGFDPADEAGLAALELEREVL